MAKKCPIATGYGVKIYINKGVNTYNRLHLLMQCETMISSSLQITVAFVAEVICPLLSTNIKKELPGRSSSTIVPASAKYDYCRICGMD
jgi:hypothetical protein